MPVDFGKTRRAGDAITFTNQMIEGWWVVATYIAPPDEAPVLAELRISPTPSPLTTAENEPLQEASDVSLPPGGLQARVLRSVHLQELEEYLRELREPPPTPPPDPGDLLVFAWEVEQATLAGGRGINVRLAQRCSMSAPQIRDRVFAARQKGYLTPAVRGLGGGYLTEKAKQMLVERIGGAVDEPPVTAQHPKATTPKGRRTRGR